MHILYFYMHSTRLLPAELPLEHESIKHNQHHTNSCVKHRIQGLYFSQKIELTG